MNEIDDLLDLLERRGGEMYGGEPVTQLQHALQCATLAQRAGASQMLIAAALLHDVGHMLADDEGAADQGRDMLHEEVAADYLRALFGPAVTEPIRLHVPAKRYLCAVDTDYLSRLSPASIASLKVQGGPMSAAERAEFERNPHYRDAIELRRWDDQAKDPSAETVSLDSLRPAVLAALRPDRRIGV